MFPRNAVARTRLAGRFELSLESLETRRLMAAAPSVMEIPAHPVPAYVARHISGPHGSAVTDGAAASQPETAIPARNRLSPTVRRELNAAIRQDMAKDNVPSVLVGIWIPGSGRLLSAQGVSNVETGQRRTFTAPFRIASLTKAFTATVVLQLVDRHRLSKADPISKWFPEFPNASKITVDNLLRMQSGIPDPIGDTFFKNYFNNTLMQVTPDELIAKAASEPDKFTPPGGSKAVYNNLNYVMLGEIVRKVTGRDIGTEIRRLILRPLGLSRTIYPVGTRLPGPLHEYGLDPKTKKLVDKTVLNPGVFAGAGAMISTLRDLRIFATVLGRGTLLKPATQQARLQTSPLGTGTFASYGEGIQKFGPFYGHEGLIIGSSDLMLYLPPLHATLVINVTRGDSDPESWVAPIFKDVYRIVFPDFLPS